MFFQLFGGIGLFLLGMVLLTDGLKSFAGEALRQGLIRFTGRPIKAFTSGALVTLLVQSSSATTVAVIGFVSAGLLTFPQAVGVVIGASVGTTGTSWLVSVLGLKISIGFYALPLVGVGALMRLLSRGRARSLGLALAGFGVIFIGIDALQVGMRGLTEVFDLAAIPSRGLVGHILMILVGAAMTVVMQSSSAAVATTLTALHTGSVSFEQAALLVIGAAIGTTFTGTLAAIGANTAAKRTALAHVLFNLAAGVIALAFLPLFLWGIREAQEHLGLEAGAVSLAAFHTAFISLGAMVFLPFIDPFSNWLLRLLPDRGPPLTRHLDDTLLHLPAVALEATQRALTETACELFDSVYERLGEARAMDDERGRQIRAGLEYIEQFLARIPPLNEGQPISQTRVAQMHAMDHLLRLQSHLKPPASMRRMMQREPLHAQWQRTRELVKLAAAGLRGESGEDWVTTVQERSEELAAMRRRERPEVFAQTAAGDWAPSAALAVLDAMRWLDRVGYHTWRICHYLGGQGRTEPDTVEAAPEEKE